MLSAARLLYGGKGLNMHFGAETSGLNSKGGLNSGNLLYTKISKLITF